MDADFLKKRAVRETCHFTLMMETIRISDTSTQSPFSTVPLPKSWMSTEPL
jgi:hypothetical protein